VRITGHEFRWHIQYPGPDGQFDTPDDLHTERHLHLPENAPTTLELLSKDYVYSPYLPHVELLEITLPGQKFTMEFDAGVPGKFELLGTQMCGYAHPNLLGDLVVHSSEEFEDWQKSLR
jgi:heme/copper-type cytochrome/quinol oxidase subunit 2